MGIIIQTVSKYNYGDIIQCNFNRYKPNTIQKGKIRAVKIYQCDAYKKECFTISYLVEPLEFCGFEHDEDEWISEVSIIGVNNKLINRPVETTNEQPKLHYLINYTTMDCQDECHFDRKCSKVGWFTDDELNSFVKNKDNVKVTYLG